MGGSLPDVRAAHAGTYFLGRYRIVDELGVGGMASVHLARMDGPGGFQKWVAIKKIHPHLVEDESFVQMFLDEARVAARISHPNVATVFDLGKHEDTYWIAMEYLHGEPLREVMRRTEELGTAMPPEIACRVIADAAEGLHAAHELLGKHGEKLGLVHRDVTPHNLFVTYDGVTKVVDFGIAKFSSRMSHTRAGTLKGKLAYMSPEQVHGEAIDRRTDVFALGVVLWELTTGQRLFRMESDLDTLAKVQECNVPRPSTLIRGYPVDLEKIVMKALSKNRGERFRTARELSRALQSLLMRRGLFIASDEVEAYTQSIFNDRIQKREAHLRWAAEVTSTINIEALALKPGLAPEVTGRSDIHAQRQAPQNRLTERNSAPAGSPNTPPVADAAAARTTRQRPPPPRPAAGMSADARVPSYAHQEVGRQLEEPHSADSDGPTIQGQTPSLETESPPDSTPSEPPTLMDLSLRLKRGGGQGSAPAASPPRLARAPEESHSAETRDEDQDDTMVALTRPEANPLQAPPTFPQVASASTGSGVSSGPPPRARPSSFGHTLGGLGEQRLSLAQQRSQGRTDSLRVNADPLPAIVRLSGPVPIARPNQGIDGAPPPPNPYTPAVPRVASLGYDNRTMTMQRKRRPPGWVVFALSCSTALLFAGVLIAIVSSTSREPVAKKGATEPFDVARATFNSAISVALTPTTLPTAPAPAPLAATPTTSSATPRDVPVVASAPTATAVTPKPTVVALTQPVTNPPAAIKPAGLGTITIVCMPKCDQITDNGVSLGAGHIFGRPVSAGRHALQLSAPSGARKNVVVDVVAGETREVRISMEK